MSPSIRPNLINHRPKESHRFTIFHEHTYIPHYYIRNKLLRMCEPGNLAIVPPFTSDVHRRPHVNGGGCVSSRAWHFGRQMCSFLLCRALDGGQVGSLTAAGHGIYNMYVGMCSRLAESATPRTPTLGDVPVCGWQVRRPRFASCVGKNVESII